MLARHDLDGKRLYVPGRPEVWLMFHGLRHHVMSPAVHSALFANSEGHTPIDDVDAIQRGADLNDGTFLARGEGELAHYLITGFPATEVRRYYIPSWEIFLGYGFGAEQVRWVPSLVLSAVPAARPLTCPTSI